MKKNEIISLIKKLNGKVGRDLTPKLAKQLIRDILEDDGVPDDADLTPEEMGYIEDLGFEIEAVEEEEEEPKKSKKKSKKEKKAEVEEEEEEEKPKKKSKKEKPEKKKAADSQKKEKKKKKHSRGAEKREKFIACIEKFITSAKRGRTREAIVGHMESKMPEWAGTTVIAYLSTGKNKKLCRFDNILVEDSKGRLSFK